MIYFFLSFKLFYIISFFFFFCLYSHLVPQISNTSRYETKNLCSMTQYITSDTRIIFNPWKVYEIFLIIRLCLDEI